MRHLLYVPTHRAAVGAIRGLVTEAAVVAAETSVEPIALVLDQAEGPWVEEHAALCRDLGSRATVVHMGPGTQDRFLRRVLAAAEIDPEGIVGHALLDRGIRYGTGPNTASLAAAHWSCDAIHRRDSDLTVANRTDGPAHPALLEVAAIGHLVADIGAVSVPQDVRGADLAQPVAVVASSYFGDPPLDRRMLFAAGRRYVEDLERLANPGDDDASIRAFVDRYFFAEPAIDYDTDFWELDTVGRTELGVSCVGGVHRELPENPMPDTLGSDYMQKNLMYQLGRPVLFHSRKMRHEYGEARTRGATRLDAVDYALRDLRYIGYWRAWSGLNQRIRRDPAAFLENGRLAPDAYADAFLSAWADARPSIGAVGTGFADIYERAAAVAGPGAADVLRAVASGARTVDLEADVGSGIETFVALVRAWPRLIEGASSSSIAP